MDDKISCGFKVCVTGGSGYIASFLIKKLLEKGYTVHATLRNLDNIVKVSLLKSLPGAEKRLVLFKADIFNPSEFDSAIQGCECVFHVAHQTHEEDTVETTINCAKDVAMSCIRSGTVKRLIYTGSIFAASPLKEDGSGFKDFVDESCWTPLHLSIPYCNGFLNSYKDAKTLAEKEILKFGKENGGSLEVVTLICGLVGGDSSLLSFITGSVALIVSHLTNNDICYNSLLCTEELFGKVPLIHIEDVCEAHIFCMENPSIQGRVMCVTSLISSAEIAKYYKENYPQYHVKQKYLDGPKRELELASSILTNNGFVYKYDTKAILDDSLDYATRHIHTPQIPSEKELLNRYQVLRFVEELNENAPILHIEDVCEANILCIVNPSMSPRFLCASDQWKKH